MWPPIVLPLVPARNVKQRDMPVVLRINSVDNIWKGKGEIVLIEISGGKIVFAKLVFQGLISVVFGYGGVDVWSQV